MPDLRRHETVILLPLLVLILIIGILPNLIFHAADASVGLMLERAEERRIVLMDGPDGDFGLGAADRPSFDVAHHDQPDGSQ